MNSRRPLLLAADAAGDRRRSLYGYDTAIVGSALTFVPYGLHGPAHGYLVSGASPGRGPVRPQETADRRRRYLRHRGDHVGRDPDAAVRLFARTLIGLAIGADSAIATAYIAEYAPKNRRGSLAMLQQWTITVGILVAYIVALIIFSAFPGGAASTGWRLVLGPGAIPALMGLGLHTQMPQS